MTMQAIVVQVRRDRLTVLDFATRQRVVVITHRAHRFCQGDIVRIRYNGVMTQSIPPQIYAINISTLLRGRGCNSCC